MLKNILNWVKSNKWLLIVLIIILSIPAIKALFVPGFFGASDDLHIGWLFEMDRAFRAFKLPPRYVPDLSFGFGYPLFNFVFPLPFYIGEIFHFVGISLVSSIKGVFLISLVFSAISMFLLLREFIDDGLSVLGSMIYLYAPYRSTDIYVRGAIGEALAFVFLPLIILGISKLYDSKKWSLKWIGILSASLGGLILTHNIVAYMFMPFALIYFVMLIIVSKNKRTFLGNVTAAVVLGLVFSIYFWLPAIADSRLMQYSTVFNFVDHFPTLRQLVTPYFGYGASVPGPGDGMSFFLGYSALILIPITLILFLVRLRKLPVRSKVLFAWSVGTFFVSIFMMNFRSSFLWGNLPLLPYFQFPWRFLTLTTFLIPVFLIVLPGFKTKKYLVILSVFALIVVSNGYFRPHDFLGREDAYYLNRYIPIESVSDEYKNLSEEYLRLPVDTSKRPANLYPRFFSDDQITVTELDETNSLDASAEILVKHQATVSYNKYLFPGWVVEANGKRLDLTAGYPFGQISFKLDSGVNSVKVYFSETKFNLLLDIASLIAAMVIIALIVIGRQKNETN